MPTEKDVQYYESLVMKEVSCKDLSFGCKILKWQEWMLIENDKTIYTIYKTEWYKCYVLENNYNNNQYIKWEFVEILWHEIRPHHLLLRLEKNWFRFEINTIDKIRRQPINIDYNRWRSIQWDMSKPFSWQSNETKIALGKLVESILDSKVE